MGIPVKYIVYSNATNAEKPHNNYRSKQEANSVRAIMLKSKQPYQYDAWSWNFNICQASILQLHISKECSIVLT